MSYSSKSSWVAREGESTINETKKRDDDYSNRQQRVWGMVQTGVRVPMQGAVSNVRDILSYLYGGALTHVR